MVENRMAEKSSHPQAVVGIDRGTCLGSISGNSGRGSNYFRVTRKLFSGRPDAAGDGPSKQPIPSQRVWVIA